VAGYRYKAFISYSHRDEVWAQWIQHALESYRVPRKLVGTAPDGTLIPARISPVFRDRADLSSAADLSSTIKQALAESECLIIVCSPDAAKSKWVGEEIREFARLGRPERVLCVIVDGEPTDGGRPCFHEALRDAGLQEPLAADVRDWADGKRVAKLKLIAGILGIRLDRLLQRDLQRRRKQWMLIALGVVVALTLVALTVVSQIAKQYEHDKAEQMAGFIVKMGETLQTDTDLETLAAISAEAANHFQNLDPDQLNAETGGKVGLVMRQTARISQLQGRTAEALEGYIKSRDFFARLRLKHPENADLLFESGNAEYYVGEVYLEQGDDKLAEQAFLAYHELTKELLASDPENPDWIMEVSYSHMNLVAWDLDSGKGIDDTTRLHMAEALKSVERVMALKPGDEQAISDYSNALAWAADVQSQVCDLTGAISSREKASGIAQSAAQSDPGSSELQLRHAFAISGVARLQAQVGMLEIAKQNLELVVAKLTRLSTADPSNVLYYHELLYRRVFLAKLTAETTNLDAAGAMYQALESDFSAESKPAGQEHDFYNNKVEFLLGYADVELRLGNKESARYFLQSAQKLLIDPARRQPVDDANPELLMQFEYQWWELTGKDDSGLLTAIKRAGDEGERSCKRVDLMARMYLIDGDRDTAEREVRYLESKGYADPAFKRFCKAHSLCT